MLAKYILPLTLCLIPLSIFAADTHGKLTFAIPDGKIAGIFCPGAATHEYAVSPGSHLPFLVAPLIMSSKIC